MAAARALQAPKQGDSESESDWNACDDAEFESEEDAPQDEHIWDVGSAKVSSQEAEAIGDRDLLELFGGKPKFRGANLQTCHARATRGRSKRHRKIEQGCNQEAVSFFLHLISL